MFPPLLANFVNGQDVMLLVTLCSLSLLLAENNRDFAEAGCSWLLSSRTCSF